MARIIDFDSFVDLREKPGMRAFIFLLEDELPFLDVDTHWIYHMEPVDGYVVRLNLDDFRALDIGRHPKVMLMADGEEVKEFAGIPAHEVLQAQIRKFLYERRREEDFSGRD